MHLHNNDKVTLATITSVLTVIVVSTTSPVIVATTNNSTGIESHPVWDEIVGNTGATPINETHTLVIFVGNGTMTVPDRGQTINMTNTGFGIISPILGDPATISASGREAVYSEDGNCSAITFHEIVRYDTKILQGKGIIIAVFDRNATGMLAPFNGMIVIGTHNEPPNVGAAFIKLWEWKSGISLPVFTNNTTDPRK